MNNNLQNEYEPDYVTAPGETLSETLHALNMSQTELAMRMDRPLKTINEIIQGKAAITAETALQLEKVLRVPASFWLKREQHYRESLARVAEESQLESWEPWLDELPLSQMIQHGWVPECVNTMQQVAETLSFFGVSSPAAWREVWERKVVAYRRHTDIQANFGSITAWLRQGELDAREIECAPYSEEKFRKTLESMRTLTIKPLKVFVPDLIHSGADAGVAIVFVPELPDTGISGATQWISPQKALIQLSLRYKTDDHLWFTLFHEAGHILLHGKRQIFLEAENVVAKEQEAEADNFARNMLINRIAWEKFIANKAYRSKKGILTFAREVDIAPGIIVGRLQHEGLVQDDHYNDLKRPLNWEDLDWVEILLS